MSTPNTKSTIDTLRIMRLPGPGKLWKLTAPLYYVDQVEDTCVVVPVNFTADGNSGPFKHSSVEPAGWIHDYLYRIGAEVLSLDGRYRRPVTRREADRIFLDALRCTGAVLPDLQWALVRALGARHWHKHPVFTTKE